MTFRHRARARRAQVLAAVVDRPGMGAVLPPYIVVGAVLALMMAVSLAAYRRR